MLEQAKRDTGKKPMTSSQSDHHVTSVSEAPPAGSVVSSFSDERLKDAEVTCDVFDRVSEVSVVYMYIAGFFIRGGPPARTAQARATTHRRCARLHLEHDRDRVS